VSDPVLSIFAWSTMVMNSAQRERAVPTHTGRGEGPADPGGAGPWARSDRLCASRLHFEFSLAVLLRHRPNRAMWMGWPGRTMRPVNAIEIDARLGGPFIAERAVDGKSPGTTVELKHQYPEL
jgi:hypothetical protein